MSMITSQPPRSTWSPKRVARLTVDQYEAMVMICPTCGGSDALLELQP